jgi:hypothetical protein
MTDEEVNAVNKAASTDAYNDLGFKKANDELGT